MAGNACSAPMVKKLPAVDVTQEAAAEAQPPSRSSSLEFNLAISELKSGISTLSDTDESSIEAVTIGDTPYTSAKAFEDLNLPPELLRSLYVEMNFEKPSKIHAISLPMILTPPYKNLITQAHNGSGKTTCFVLGMLSRIDPMLKAPQALCICPTRELAIQNMEVLLKMGKITGITSELAIPSANSTDHITISKRPPITAHVVIGTPGTIDTWMMLKKLGMSQMKILVFDETDHMLEADVFRKGSVKIMKMIAASNPNCQVLLFSATINDVVKAFVSEMVKEIFVINCLPKQSHLFTSVDEVINCLLDLPPEKWGLPAFEDWVEGTLSLKPCYIGGPVIKGFGRGSKVLGIPTANLSTDGYSDLLSEYPSGVYFGWAGLANRGVYKMVMSIGWNPYFNNSEKTIEPWLLHDFEDDFYGEDLHLAIVGYIRPEANFSSLESLISKIHEDRDIAEKALELPLYSKYRDDPYLRSDLQKSPSHY